MIFDQAFLLMVDDVTKICVLHNNAVIYQIENTSFLPITVSFAYLFVFSKQLVVVNLEIGSGNKSQLNSRKYQNDEKSYTLIIIFFLGF